MYENFKYLKHFSKFSFFYFSKMLQIKYLLYWVNNLSLEELHEKIGSILLPKKVMTEKMKKKKKKKIIIVTSI